MVQMDFLEANQKIVHIIGLCGQVHHVIFFAIAQLSCFHYPGKILFAMAKTQPCPGWAYLTCLIAFLSLL